MFVACGLPLIVNKFSFIDQFQLKADCLHSAAKWYNSNFVCFMRLEYTDAFRVSKIIIANQVTTHFIDK